jgi:hypothetical protein
MDDRHRRLLGVFPLLFVAFAIWRNGIDRRLGDALWLCNVGNAMVGFSLLAGAWRWAWIGTLWVAIGLPMWCWHITITGSVYAHSFFTHVGTPIVAIFALYGKPAPRLGWLWATCLGLVVQTVSRFATRPELNVNVSHSPYEGLGNLFASYPVYFAFNLCFFAAALFAIERGLVWGLRGPRDQAIPSSRASEGSRRGCQIL